MNYSFSKNENKIRNWWAMLFIVSLVSAFNSSNNSSHSNSGFIDSFPLACIITLVKIALKAFVCATFYCSYIKQGVRLLTAYIVIHIVAVITLVLAIILLISKEALENLLPLISYMFSPVILEIGLVVAGLALSFKLRKINKRYLAAQQEAA